MFNGFLSAYERVNLAEPRFALAARGYTIMPWNESAQMHQDKAPAVELGNIRKKKNKLVHYSYYSQLIVDILMTVHYHQMFPTTNQIYIYTRGYLT